MSEPVTLARAVLYELAHDPAAIDELRSLLHPDEPERLLSPKEAAERIGCNPKWLVRVAGEGRVPGAERHGRLWKFRPSTLEILPPPPRSPVSAGAGRGARRAGASAAVNAMRGEDRKAA